MRAATLLSLPLLATASAIVKRDAASINTAIGYISGNITKLNTTLNGFGYNDTITGIAILFQSGDLKTAVTNAASVVNASEPLNDADSGSVAYTVLNLEPQIFSLLDNLVAHKPEFQTVILGGDGSFLVKSNLQDSKTAADDFGNALVPKLSASYQSAAPQVVQQIDAKFDSAIAAFS